MFAEDFEDRILPFGEDAAPLFAAISMQREQSGRPTSQFDAMIAAICKVRRAAIATRNVSDFEQCGIRIINPWEGKNLLDNSSGKELWNVVGLQAFNGLLGNHRLRHRHMGHT